MSAAFSRTTRACGPVQERLKRVQYRSQQAENALKHLEKCIDVINDKRSSGVTGWNSEGSDKVRELERENEQLKKEAEILKEKLINLEILNGVSQIPATMPPPIATNQEVQVATPLEDPSDVQPKPVSEPVKEKPKEKKSKSKDAAPKTTSKSGGKGSSQASDKPIDVSRLDMRIGQILNVKKHPEADTLYVEEIDLGEGSPRTVCSGLVNNIPIEQMENRMVVAMCNLKPAKMRGVVSQAMVMCASSPDKVEILDPPVGAVPGDRVVVEGYPGTPDEQLNPKKKIFEQVQPDLNTNEEGVACYKEIPWMVPGKGPMKSQTMKNSPIK